MINLYSIPHDPFFLVSMKTLDQIQERYPLADFVGIVDLVELTPDRVLIRDYNGLNKRALPGHTYLDRKASLPGKKPKKHQPTSSTKETLHTEPKYSDRPNSELIQELILKIINSCQAKGNFLSVTEIFISASNSSRSPTSPYYGCKVSMSGVSTVLRDLARKGVVCGTRDKFKVYYRIAEAAVQA